MRAKKLCDLPKNLIVKKQTWNLNPGAPGGKAYLTSLWFTD